MVKVKEKVDFTGKKIEVGLDVHKKKWNVSIFLEGSFIKKFQQPPVVKILAAHLKENYPGASYFLAYEAGFCGFWISRQFKEQGMDCIVINPGDLPQTNKGRVNKTDDKDSRTIGEALSGGMLKPIYIPSPEQESDRLLVRYRIRLQRDITRCQLRIKSLLNQLGINIPEQYYHGYWSKRFIQWLKNLRLPFETSKTALNYMIEQLLLLRPQLLEVIRSLRRLYRSERYQKQHQLLMSVPGIGPITAITLLTEIGDIKRFKNFYRFNSFIGFCPSEYSSGEKERRGSMTFRHHSSLRVLILEAAWTAIQHDPALTLAYEELKKKIGGKRAIIKIARKLLHRIFTIWRKEEVYEKGIVQ
jgi:transposase